MKNIINIKETMIIIFTVLILVLVSTDVFALNLNNVLENGSTGGTPISPNEYDGAQEPNVVNNNNITNNIANNTTNNSVSNNKVKSYNTNNKTDLPQTGIEDYNIGILIIICVGSAIFAYKKISDYKNV